MSHNRRVWIGICLAGLMAVTLYAGLTQHPSSFDDAYISYRYARNIAQGRGFVYNLGEPVLGTTTALYTLLLAGMSVIWQDIPTLSHVIGIVAWLLCIPTIYGIVRTDGHELAALISASLIATNALFLNVLGMETTVYVLVALLAFYFFLNERYTWAGVCAGLAFLTRWDGILVTGVLAFAGMLERRKQSHRSLLVSACFVVPWLVYSQLTFGSIFPNTLFAKAGQGWNQDLGGTEIGSFARALIPMVRSACRQNRLVLVLVGSSAVGAVSALRDRRRWWPLLLWTAAYFTGYTVLGVLSFPWYYPPLVPAFLLLVGQGVEELIEPLPRSPKWPRVGLTVLVVALCLIPSVDRLLANRRSGMDKHLATYVEVGKWLRDHTAPDSSVATIEIGVIGFYSDRTIVDPMGLVSPEMVGHLESWLQTLQFALNYYWPDYAVALEGTAWGGARHEPWFREAYVLETEVENLADPGAPLRIYRRRAGFPPVEFALVSTQEARFDQTFALRRFQVAEEVVNPGEKLHVELLWKALSDVKDTYLLRFDLLNATNGEGMTLRRDAQPMRGGNPTHLWSEGDQVIDSHTLAVPDEVEAGPYLLRLLVSREGESPTITDCTGNALDYVVAGPIQIDSGTATTRIPAHAVDATFADHVSLVGYDSLQRGGDALKITLYWQATAEISEDYTVFVHLLSPNGELVAQHDSPPALPTKLWVPGRLVVDSHVIPLPQSLPSASYELRVGMYHWPELERLPIVEPNGLDATGNALLIRDIPGSPSQAP